MLGTGPHSKKKICYYYDESIGNYYYGPNHPMKPQRVRMAHHLIMNYGLYRKMEIYRPKKASSIRKVMTTFHSTDYISFLRKIRPDNIPQYDSEMRRFNLGDDCPVFDGLYDFCKLSSVGSLAGTVKLNRQETDIAVNWSGGLHHAKKSEASGFCYVNDIVLAILEFLKYHQRVIYIDIDVHHGDGVEEAFYDTDRVMTVSFHQYGEDFFPGTGGLYDVGAKQGKYYSVNCPLLEGIRDEAYDQLFQDVMEKVMAMYQPGAIVLQCGADSLNGDRLGRFNLTLKGHGKCVEFMKKYNLPLLVLGGGGYTTRNVARCWTYETSVLLGCDIDNNLPNNAFMGCYKPDYKLHIRPSTMANKNTKAYLNDVKMQLFENLRNLAYSPGVQMQDVPDDADIEESDDEVDILNRPDERISASARDKHIAREEEFSSSEDEDENGSRRNRESFKVCKRLQPQPRNKECPDDKQLVPFENLEKCVKEKEKGSDDTKTKKRKEEKKKKDESIDSNDAVASTDPPTPNRGL